MDFKNYKDIEIKHPKSNARIAKIVNNDDAVVVHMTLEVGQGLHPHITPVDVKFFILQGEVSVLVGEEEQVFTTGSIVDSPKNIMHNVTNAGDTEAKLLVIKTPNPDSAQYI